jgi:hypothetical protein
MQINSGDDAGTLMQKLAEAQNELTSLFEELKVRGGELNEKNGLFAETKAKIRVKKEQINTIKVLIRAEGSHL